MAMETAPPPEQLCISMDYRDTNPDPHCRVQINSHTFQRRRSNVLSYSYKYQKCFEFIRDFQWLKNIVLLLHHYTHLWKLRQTTKSNTSREQLRQTQNPWTHARLNQETGKVFKPWYSHTFWSIRHITSWSGHVRYAKCIRCTFREVRPETWQIRSGTKDFGMGFMIDFFFKVTSNLC